MNWGHSARAIVFCFGALGAVACSKKEEPPAALAATASALPSAEAAPQAAPFDVETASSRVSFAMEAPLEKILGEAPSSISGELFVDAKNLARSTGTVKIDLLKLTLYQQKRGDEKEQYGDKVKNDTQNEHAQNWLEIAKDSPNREQNRYLQFRIDELSDLSASDLGQLSGAERKVTATARGELFLHGHKEPKSAKVELVFGYSGDRLASVKARSLAPVPVNLAAFEVKPRDAFGSLLQKGLDALAPKVAKEAPIEFELVARAR